MSFVLAALAISLPYQQADGNPNTTPCCMSPVAGQVVPVIAPVPPDPLPSCCLVPEREHAPETGHADLRERSSETPPNERNPRAQQMPLPQAETPTVESLVTLPEIAPAVRHRIDVIAGDAPVSATEKTQTPSALSWAKLAESALLLLMVAFAALWLRRRVLQRTDPDQRMPDLRLIEGGMPDPAPPAARRSPREIPQAA